LVLAALTALTFAASAVVGAAAQEPPKVVVSIAPIHSLVAAVMEGVGEPYLIVAGAGSPHAYALRPSEAEALQNADLVVWVGESMETFLADTIPTLAPGAQVLELMEVPGVTVLAMREGDGWEPHEHEGEEHDEEHEEDHEGDEHEEDHEHEHEGVDGHIWLDPENAKAIVAATAEQLAEIDPAHAATYRANGERARDAIDASTADIAQRIAPVADKPYIVFHDAYQYFQRHFGTLAVGSVTVSPEKQPGAARIAEIRRRLVSEGVICVFREPQFSPQVIETIVEGTDVRIGVLDPLGAGIAPGPRQYEMLMTALADGLVACLAD
jgi:zinc transport system substrate-binding protein